MSLSLNSLLPILTFSFGMSSASYFFPEFLFVDTTMQAQPGRGARGGCERGVRGGCERVPREGVRVPGGCERAPGEDVRGFQGRV